MHLVNEEYDSGEILSQIEVPVLPVILYHSESSERNGKNSPCCSTKRAVDKQKLEFMSSQSLLRVSINAIG